LSVLERARQPPTPPHSPTSPPPPQHTWFGKGQFGFLDSKGNSDAESINGKSAGVVSAERWEAHESDKLTTVNLQYSF